MIPRSSQDEQGRQETPLECLTSAGLSTLAILTQPSSPTNQCVILCHGFLSDKQSRTNRRLTELLVSQGIATCRFDWHGMGDTHEYFSTMTLKQCEDQLEAVSHTLQMRGMHRLGLIGSSFGGLVSILAAPKQHGLLALGLKCPVVDFPEVLRLEFGPKAMEQWHLTNQIPNILRGGTPVPLHYRFYEECLASDAYAASSRIQVPTLTVYGDQDELIPRHQIDRLMETLNSKKELHVIEGADHQFGQPETFRLMTIDLSRWMVQHLEDVC